ncbi:MAG: twitching motility protein PilT [Spirochaetes bacterium GWF1_51_8]|nr:MAG: twitching motility protein PilT [Spirochaetes bacterium GWF1_51_8]
MRYLIDTHAFLWCTINDERLSRKIIEIVENIDNEIFFSAVSGWEIAIKYQLGKLVLSAAPEIFITEQIENNQYTVLPITLLHALTTRELPLIHKDPFDRMLVAQSKIENLPILSNDSKLSEYDVDIIW